MNKLTDENQVVFNTLMRRILQDYFEVQQIIPVGDLDLIRVQRLSEELRDKYNPIDPPDEIPF